MIGNTVLRKETKVEGPYYIILSLTINLYDLCGGRNPGPRVTPPASKDVDLQRANGVLIMSGERQEVFTIGCMIISSAT